MTKASTRVVVTGAFDDLRSAQVRFLQEAAKLGRVTVLLWSDQAASSLLGKTPKFPESERLYVLRAIRFVDHVHLISGPVHQDALPEGFHSEVSAWVVQEPDDTEPKGAFCKSHNLQYHVMQNKHLHGFPEISAQADVAPIRRKKVLVTGCYDWLHSGHVRFFEEVSGYGDVYAVVGRDANIRLLKGEGHPLLSDQERRYMVGSIRHVKQALISTGHGWLDAEPEIERIKPDIYAVNEDGDKGGKREYCAQHNIEYLVLKRVPALGLPSRSGTSLRGF